ncbi:MAG: Non-ribosomal peptide synthase domain TIGR01720/amino acid adenylation protein [Amycolatopsis sp.]|uniref:amino acid adenylation domain-containing protein n=1 Tax=Amycolatopsis sp. TaxID=37632 RepID=UPI00261D6814|nr:amino acid adenylation domain-containing protein [Amycolatopsis sp.]MCU1686541.1 Non-ribosomal peptide synthase domain TIGR01720/amino acid adenylation protein [Amycolatopsis sp.]
MTNPGTVEDILPLSPLQQGMFFHAQFDETATDVYTVQFVLGLDGDVDHERLRSAADALLVRHPNLRACFEHEDLDEPVQIVLAGVELPWSEVDLFASDDRDAAFARLLAADRATRFDLAEPPLIRFLLVRFGPREYRLVLSNHHILLDGWSVPLLVRDLLDLYAANPLPTVRPYRDYLAWLASKDSEQAAAVWASALDGVTGSTLLAPAEPSRVPVRPELYRLEFPGELTARLSAEARVRGLTINTVLQGIWGLVLGKLTGRDDVVFGATVSGRPADLPGVDSMVGLFINTVPVRVRAHPGATVPEVLSGLQRDQGGLLDVQFLGLSEIRRAAGVGDLFDTLVVFENYPIDTDAVARREASAGLRVTPIGIDDATHYPLTLAVAAEKTLTVTFEFRPDIFARERIETIAGYFRRAAESIASGAEPTVARLDLLGIDERRRLLGFGTGKRLPGLDVTMPEVFEAQTARTPDAIAVVSGAIRLTFAQINVQANRLARVLVERGAGPERVVALALPPGPDVLVAMVAVMKAGSAYLPLDPEWPAERLDVMISDARPVVVLREMPATDGVSGDDFVGPAKPDNPAYVIYTSGSTGKPKAVVVSHRSIVNLLVSHRDALFEPASRAAGGRPLRVGHAWPMVFDASWQPMLWMFAGHELHLVPPDVRRDADEVRAFLAAHRIEFIELSPSLLGEVVAEPGWRGELKVLGVGGEAVPLALWQRLRETDGLTVYNLYGPTECTVDSAACEFGEGVRPSIGSPVGNARAYILDIRLGHCPVGVSGELYIAGAGLARGYLGQAAVTSGRFVADPFGGPGARMYRSGDVARWTADGLIDCLGRVDDQVKIRGFRVEPGEIEAVLLRDVRVTRAAVVVREDAPGARRLVAYVVASGTEGLRELVADALPEYMVPAAVLAVAGFPLTHNGKLDTEALPSPERTGWVVAPRTELETRLTTLFAEVLGLDEVGIDDSFFALGGDSIVSMRLVSKARSAGLRFSPRDVFDRRTVAGLALATQDAAPRVSRVPDAGVGEIPLTPMLVWLANQASPYGRLSQARFLCTPAELDESTLLTLAQTMLDRHDVLRSSFRRSSEGDWTFTSAPAGTVSAGDVVRTIDVRGLGFDEIAARLPAVLEEALAELAPASGEMARFVWFDTGAEGRLLILLHHLVVDGASWGVLVPELAEDWDLLRRGEPLPTYDGTSFREWAIGLADAAKARVSEVDLWREILSGPDPVLGTRRLDPVADTRATMLATRTSLDPVVTTALLTVIPEQHGVPVDAVLLTGLALAVARWRGDTDDSSLLLALESHGREEQVVPGAELSGTVGWFTSVFPVRVDPGDIERDGTGKGLLRVAEQLTVPDKGIGHGLLRYLNPDTASELEALPEPQLEFNYLGRLTVGEREGRPFSGAPETGAMGGGVDAEMPAPYCLVLNVLVRDLPAGPVLEADWQWPGALFTEDRIRELSREWFAALELLTKGDLR